jgi:hypothetical protein
MRISLLAIILICLFSPSRAQSGYVGCTADYNSGIGERYTYGLGLHAEFRVRKCENLYFNWHYSIGSNTHGELYGHGGLSLLLYKDPDWWRYAGNSWESALGALFGPLLIPNGMTYYLPNYTRVYDHNVRIGIYCNPIAMEHWDTSPFKVTSWTIEGGAKLLWETKGDRVVYLAGGIGVTHNMRRIRSFGDYGNEELVHIQLGLLGLVE